MKRIGIFAGAAVVALAAAFGAGRFSAPTKVQTVTVTEWKDRTLERQVAGPVRIVTRVVERPAAEAPSPPGCPECPAIHETTTTEDRAPVTVERVADSSSTSSTSTTTTREYPRLMLGLGAGYPLAAFRLDAPEFGGLAAYRFAGALSAWAAGSRSYLLAGVAVTF